MGSRVEAVLILSVVLLCGSAAMKASTKQSLSTKVHSRTISDLPNRSTRTHSHPEKRNNEKKLSSQEMKIGVVEKVSTPANPNISNIRRSIKKIETKSSSSAKATTSVLVQSAPEIKAVTRTATKNDVAPSIKVKTKDRPKIKIRKQTKIAVSSKMEASLQKGNEKPARANSLVRELDSEGNVFDGINVDIAPSVNTIGANSDQFSGSVKNILGNSRNERASTQTQISTSLVTGKKVSSDKQASKPRFANQEKIVRTRRTRKPAKFTGSKATAENIVERIVRKVWNKFQSKKPAKRNKKKARKASHVSHSRIKKHFPTRKPSHISRSRTKKHFPPGKSSWKQRKSMTARYTKIPFLTRKTKLHYEYSSKWPVTCPCELATGMLKGTCWYFTGNGAKCKHRTCRPSYVCVVGARTPITCMRRTITKRIVSNDDGTCRSEQQSGFFYMPYSRGLVGY